MSLRYDVHVVSYAIADRPGMSTELVGLRRHITGRLNSSWDAVLRFDTCGMRKLAGVRVHIFPVLFTA
jgi:hypothetical protein